MQTQVTKVIPYRLLPGRANAWFPPLSKVSVINRKRFSVRQKRRGKKLCNAAGVSQAIRSVLYFSASPSVYPLFI